MKRMLINATQPEELRVALVDGQWLYDLDIENRNRQTKKSNIYKGRITRVEPSLEAAFVDYGAERHGFLPLKEIAREYFYKNPGELDGRLKIKDVVKEGTEVIVQVDKEERGNKGAALTTFVSLAGRYLVLMPNNPRAGGISRRIEGEDRAELRDALSAIEMPQGMGVIIRTAGVGRSAEELQWDLNYLLHLWSSIDDAAKDAKAPAFLFQESNVIIRAIRDYLRQDVGEVIVDNKEAYDLASTFVEQVMPNFRSKVKLYEDDIPLFNRYQIESQIETAFQREVKLPSGGSIVIDVTEALVSIDINSSRATKGSDIEETALQTNVEAADEIARQLRLRDMGGLVVIDFIDMQPVRNQREVETRMRDALAMDRARVQIGRISRFGLLEMSRQRLRPSLGEVHSKVCPRCNGQGTIRGTRSLALSILRLVEEEAQKERSAEIRAIAPVTVATYLLNEKRKTISNIEQRNKTRVVIVPNAEMMTPHFEVQRLRDDDEGTLETSYKIVVSLDEHTGEEVVNDSKPLPVAQPLVQPTAPTQPAPEPTPPKPEPGLFSRLIAAIKALFKSEEEEAPKKRNQSRRNERGGRNSGNNNSRRRGGRRNNSEGRNDNRSNKRDDQNTADNKANTENKGNADNKGNAENKGDKPSENREGGNRRGGRNRRRGGRRDGNEANRNEPRDNNRTDQRDEQEKDKQKQVAQADEPAAQSTPESNEQEQGGDNQPPKRPSGRKPRQRRRRRDQSDGRDLEKVGNKAAEAEIEAQAQEEATKAEQPKAETAQTPRSETAESAKQAESKADSKPESKPKTEQASEARQALPRVSQRQVNEPRREAEAKTSDAAPEQPKATEPAPAQPETSAPEVNKDAPVADADDDKIREANAQELRALAEQVNQAINAQRETMGDPEAEEAPVVPAADSAAEVQAESAVARAARLASRPEAEDQAEVQPEVEAEPEADAQPKAQADAQADSAVEADVEAEPVAEPEADVVTPTPKAAPTAPQAKVDGKAPRASNDPRLAPKPLSKVEIVTETLERPQAQALDTSQPPAVEYQPRPVARPTNDPRKKNEEA
ncbi:ribonuclease E [Marinimicrobium alkaliphilum]|uniref:ribonuclease E n=1 Tax=Marinimicrobium alkaliphilum TaxID=2202654 RepID=UPI000DB958E4|nr:ribonuclease E [Marinimicrobium alkaliphilum]